MSEAEEDGVEQREVEMSALDGLAVTKSGRNRDKAALRDIDR